MSWESPKVITHKLSVYKEAQTVTQRKQKMGEEKCTVVRAEAEKLLEAG